MAKTNSIRVIFSDVSPYDVAGMRKNASSVKNQIIHSGDFKPSDSTLIKFSANVPTSQNGSRNKTSNGTR